MHDLFAGGDGAGSLTLSRTTARSGWPCRAAAVTFAALLLVTSLAVAPATSAQDAGRDDEDRVTTTDLRLRSAPALDTAVLDVMPRGTEVAVLAEPVNGFLHVDFDGQAGWAHEDYLAAPTEVPAGAALPAVNGADGYSEAELVQIIHAAADRYGQPREDMLRVARCESVLNPAAVNASSNASGLFQFLPSTWATTPYAGQDIFDPVANAEAAAWMWSEGRRGEWVCQ